MKPKLSHPEHVIHASIGYKKRLDEILASRNTLAGMVDTSGANPKKSPTSANKPKSNKREQPTAKNRAKMLMKPKQVTIPNNSGKQKMPEINQKKERVIHPQQVKQMAKKVLVIKSEKTDVEINPAGAKYHYNKKQGWHANPNLGKSTVKPKKSGSDTGISGKKVGAKPASSPASTTKFKNPLAPHKLETNKPLFSMFDKPSEYNAIRSGKAFVKPSTEPEYDPKIHKKPPQSKKSGTSVGSAPKASPLSAIKQHSVGAAPAPKPKKERSLMGAARVGGQDTNVTQTAATNPNFKWPKPSKKNPKPWLSIPVHGESGGTSGGSSGGDKPPKPPKPPKESSFGMGEGSDGKYRAPAHPNGKLESYSPLRHFSNLFRAPVTARASAAARGAIGSRQIFRPQSLVMKKTGESTFKQKIMKIITLK